AGEARGGGAEGLRRPLARAEGLPARDDRRVRPQWTAIEVGRAVRRGAPPRRRVADVHRRDGGRGREAPAAAAAVRLVRPGPEDAGPAEAVARRRAPARGRLGLPPPRLPAQPARPRRAADPAGPSAAPR